MNEEWKVISDYPIYSVSNTGRIWNNQHNCEVFGCLDKTNGYLVVNLYNSNGHHKIAIHRLVANAFLANKSNKRTVNHIDCNKTNNDVSNLEWANDSEQMIHAYKNGLCENTRRQALKNLYSHGRYVPTEIDRQRSREMITELNKRPKTEKQLETSRKNINLPQVRKAAVESHFYRHPLIKCVETGETNKSQRDLANKLGISESGICAVLHGRRTNASGYHFEYVTESY